MQITVTDEDRKQAREALKKDAYEYLREVEDAAEEGFRIHYCFHGTNLWTDYDPICGPCEDGAYEPRHHRIDGPEFTEMVENWATSLARKNRYNLILDMIKGDAQDINTRSDLAALKIKIDLALDLYN